MLREQVALLNYLDEQNNAIINGLAGTGKTVMAVEKARRHSEKDEKVLFLCYNTFLNEHLREKYPYPHVSYYTVAGLSQKLCEKVDYKALQEKLTQMFLEGIFPYQHVIIDEGQDFGKEEIDEVEIIELLRENAIDNEEREHFICSMIKIRWFSQKKLLNILRKQIVSLLFIETAEIQKI